MVKIMENPIEMDDLGGFPIILGNAQIWWPKDINAVTVSNSRS